MKIYAYKNNIIRFEEVLNSYYLQSFQIEEQNHAYVPFSEEQTAFYLQHPEATVMEVWNMKLQPSIPPEELRRRAYEKEIPRELIDSFITYTAEGKKALAKEVAEKITQIKQNIRERYPD